MATAIGWLLYETTSSWSSESTRPAGGATPAWPFCGRRGAFIGVSTAITPGSAVAAATSMRTMRPLATLLVTSTA